MRPYGYENDRATVRDHEAELIRSAAARLIDGESLRSIVTSINEDGHRTPAGNQWQANVLRRVLLSPRIAGKEQSRGGRLRKADWPAILDDVTWKQVGSVLSDKNRRTPGSGGTAARRYLLTGGIARCGLCGKPLVARPGDGKRGYVCATGNPYGGCGRIRIVADLLEADVVERVLARLLRPDAKERLQEAFDAAREDAKAAPEVIAAAEKRLEEIGRDYADGVIRGRELRGAQDLLNKRIRDARAAIRLGAMIDNVGSYDAEDLVEWWETASLEQQRTAIEILVDRVEVHPVTVRGSKTFDPSRVKVFWKRTRRG